MKKETIREDLVYSKIVESEESKNIVRGSLQQDFEEFSSLGLIKDGTYNRVEFAIEEVFEICHLFDSNLAENYSMNRFWTSQHTTDSLESPIK